MTIIPLRALTPIPIDRSESVRIEEIATAIFRERPWRNAAERGVQPTTMSHRERLAYLEEHCPDYRLLRDATRRAARNSWRAGLTRWDAVDGIRRIVGSAADGATDTDVAIEVLADVTAWTLDVYSEYPSVVARKPSLVQPASRVARHSRQTT